MEKLDQLPFGVFLALSATVAWFGVMFTVCGMIQIVEAISELP